MYHAIVTGMADEDEVMALVAQAPDDAHGPNHMNAAVHYLILGGLDHPLAAVYEGTSDADPAPLFADLVLAHRGEVLELMSTRHVQTNEIGRVASIAPSLSHVERLFAMPVALADIGCSAGLNLLLDRYRVDYGKASVGPADAEVVVAGHIRTGDPPLDDVDIAWRRGYDRSPIDITDPDSARWLRALVWPDHPDRGERLVKAIELAAADPPVLETADAVTAVERAARDTPDDLMLVLLTTWTWFYFDVDTRSRFERAIVDAGRPVAWISMELEDAVEGLDPVDRPENVGEASVMGLVTGGEGAEVRRQALGWTHPHGEWLAWTAGDLSG